jgi:hypothetical protein
MTEAYTVDYSCRFNDDDTAKLTRTPAFAGNRKTWTWSGWVKRGNLGAHIMFGTGTLLGTANDMVLWFNGSDQIAFYRNSVYILRTNAVLETRQLGITLFFTLTQLTLRPQIGSDFGLMVKRSRILV